MFCGERHPKYPTRPKIDYDVVMMLNPGLAAGVTVGVMVNIVSPQWVIILVLIVTLVLALQKSYSKGIAQWKQESEALAAAQAALQQSGGGPGGAGSGGAGGGAARPIQIKLADFRTFSVLANENFRPLALITGCWAVFLVANILKAKQCSLMYWAQLAGLLVVCGAFTFAGARIVTEQACAKDVPEGWSELASAISDATHTKQ